MKLDPLIEDRSEPLNLPKVHTLLAKHCQQSLSATPIWRGLYGDRGSYLLVKPKNHYRVSANTDNIYTALLDGLPSWAALPKRSRSLICSTRQSHASSFGSVYRVFPFDGARIGICPEADFWNSFKIGMMDTFNTEILELCKVAKVPHHTVYPTNGPTQYQNMVTALRQVEKAFRAKPDLIRNSFEYWSTGLMHRVMGGADILKELDKILNPTSNGFSLQTIDEFSIGNTNGLEVWTDSPCIMVHRDLVT